MAKSTKGSGTSSWAKTSIFLLLLAALGYVGYRRLLVPAPLDPLAAVPRASFLVATIDLDALRASPLHDVLLGSPVARGVRAAALGEVERACGFDPLTRVRSLAIAVPEREGQHDFGVIARMTVTGAELQGCQERLEANRGGEAAKAPAVETRGSFAIVRGVSSASREAALAFGRELLVVSGGAWLDSIVATANGAEPSVETAAEHAELRRALVGKAGWEKPTAVATAVLPRTLRDRLRAELDERARTMAGVLGVSSAGAALRIGAAGGEVELRTVLVCETAEACDAVEELIRREARDLAGNLAFALAGGRQLIDALEVKREATRLEVSTRVPVDFVLSRAKLLGGG